MVMAVMLMVVVVINGDGVEDTDDGVNIGGCNEDDGVNGGGRGGGDGATELVVVVAKVPVDSSIYIDCLGGGGDRTGGGGGGFGGIIRGDDRTGGGISGGGAGVEVETMKMKS
ncbi:ctenidin-1-like [Papaver somniferum]|uniref:ctenidin-1-like n=1 Tax=Papaver somniferum TaxID=3469 RepID=UPI000E6FE7A8|nr:ctenidin-1-like [Papaver somniferum]